MIFTIEQVNIDNFVKKIADQVIRGKQPSFELAIEFLNKCKEQGIELSDPSRYLLLNYPDYIAINKINSFSELTPYNLLRNGFSASFYTSIDTQVFYDYSKHQGYSDKTILRVNPDYIKFIKKPSIDMYAFILKRIKYLGKDIHGYKISFIFQSKSKERLLRPYSVDEDLKLLQNKLKIMQVVS